MKKVVEVLLSVMKIKNEQELIEKIKQNKITTKVIAINQIQEGENIFRYEKEDKAFYTYIEKGASKSRNRLLEKAKGDICIFADDDMVYKKGYEEIIQKEFEKNKKADVIIFQIENHNKNREKIKKIGNKKVNRLDIMKARTPEIAFKRDIIQKYNLKFDEKFGPNSGMFSKGEETIFLADCLKKKIKIYSTNSIIGYVFSEESSWFKGFDKKYLHDQGAIFFRIYPKWYKIFMIQYVIRKHKLYKENVKLSKAYKEMKAGAKECQKIMKIK